VAVKKFPKRKIESVTKLRTDKIGKIPGKWVPKHV